MTRVGFVVHVMQVAGAEVLVKETIRRLGNRIVPTVFCLDRLGTLGEELQSQGVDVVCFDRQPGRDYGVSWRMAREIAQRKLDVLHAHQYSPFFYAALAKLLLKRKPRLILTEHGRHYPDMVSPKRRAFNRLVLDRCADAVNACCQFSADALGDLDGFAGRRIEIIRNGIEVEHYHPAVDVTAEKRRLGFDERKRYLIHVARHHPVKDQPTLLRGFAKADVDGLELLMVGDGPQRGKLEELTRTLGIGDRVRFLGIRRDIPQVLRVAEAFALTSVSEAASLTLLEAMATSLPAIVSAVGGNGEIVREGREGYLFPRGDAGALSRALQRTFQYPEASRQLGQNGRQRVLEQYRLEQTIAAYAKLYES